MLRTRTSRAIRGLSSFTRARLPEVWTDPSPIQFERHLSQPEDKVRPLLLNGLTKHWDALTDWTLSNSLGKLRHNDHSDSNVEIELVDRGKGYLDPSWKRVEMPLSLFLDAFMLNRLPSSVNTTIGFLAQQDLFSLIPELESQAPCLDFAHLGPKNQFWRRNVWIGPPGTFSPIHKDPYHNLYCQVTGSKRVHVFPPSSRESLYISNHPLHLNTSTIPSPPTSSLSPSFPLFDRAMEDAVVIQIQGGETLFIPEGWWHCLEATGDEGSVSVNHWFR